MKIHLAIPAALALTGCAPDEAGRAPWNLLVLSVDTLRRDHLDRYGGLGDTPFLDSRMDRALTLDAHRSCSNWTYGSIACALGGADGVELGFVPRMAEDRVPDDLVLLVDRAARAGMGTGLVSTNPYLSSGPFASRHDEFLYDVGLLADDVVDEGLDMLEVLSAEGEPWYLHLHFIDPHDPYDPPAEHLEGLSALAPLDYNLRSHDEYGRLEQDWWRLDDDTRALALEHLRLRYRGELRFLDVELARLWRALDERGALESTAVLFWSDHGEQFFEHNGLTHGRSLHDPEVAAAAFVMTPTITPGGVSTPTSHADLVPTLFDAMGLPRPADSPGQVAARADEERPLFGLRLSAEDTLQSVDRGDLRMVYRWRGQVSVYDRAQDPGESVDIFTPRDPRHRALWELLRPRVAGAAAIDDRASPVWPPL